MCGIVGYLNFNQDVACESELRAMMSRITHRGPDASGTWCQGPVGLGHLRLSILDLSPRGNQPFVSHDGQGVLVYNGEVYNFGELRSELEAEGAVFRSTSDTEVVLEAVHRWGPERAIPRFNGMFAFAYYDLRTKELWLTRDRLGIKPLYIAKTGKCLVFASEMKAILAHPSVAARPDLHALTVHMLCEAIEEDWTPFENIRTVTPGRIVRWEGRDRTEIQYFDPLEALDVDRLKRAASADRNDVVQNFEDAFGSSVRMHMISDAPLAAMCSGGVDSSMIAAFMRVLRPDLKAYVADVKGTYSEGAAARRMGQHLNIDLRQVDVDQAEYLRLLPWAVWHNDQPNHFPHDPAFLAVAQRCRADGIKVLLTGEGSDEMFGGYPWHENIWRMYRRRRRIESFIPTSGRLGQLWRALGKVASSDQVAALRQPFRAHDQLSRVVGNSTNLTVSPYAYALAAYGGQRMLREEAIFDRLRGIDPIEERAFLAKALDDLYGYLRMLLQRNDRMGMAASIESRFPFLENGLIDFALHLPFNRKYRDGAGKWIVKQVAIRKLPVDTVYAPKVGFSITESFWMPGLALLHDGWCAETFKWESRNQQQIVERIAESPRLSYLLLCCEIWGREFFGAEKPDAIADALLSHVSPTVRDQPIPRRKKYVVDVNSDVQAIPAVS